jgi:hypothetical protein
MAERIAHESNVTDLSFFFFGKYCDGFAQGIAEQRLVGLWSAWLAVTWYPSRMT